MVKQLVDRFAPSTSVAPSPSMPFYPPRPNDLFPLRNGQIFEKCILQKFYELTGGSCSKYAEYKVIAGIVMIKNKDWSNPIALSIGTGSSFGNKCKNWHGYLVDCHAEIVARRGFVKFLYHEIGYAGRSDSLFGIDGNQYFLKPNYKFYLYVSTAPCGDGRVFSHSELSPNEQAAKFTGLLRRKGDEALDISLDKYKGNKKRIVSSMSCSDKILKWNVVGLQGALLSKFLREPIYLEAVCIGEKFQPDHFERAIYGRLNNNLKGLPKRFKLNKPWTMGVQESLAASMKDSQNFHSVNWHFGCRQAEIIDSGDGSVIFGCCNTMAGKKYSQISKYAMFVAYQSHHQDKIFRSPPPNTYIQAKQRSAKYQVLVVMTKLKEIFLN